jgi:hypothetical protein
MKNSLSKAVTLALFVAGVAGSAILATVRNDSPGYPNSTRRVFEKPVFHSKKNDVVEIVRWGAPLTQVRTKSGRIGWMESVRLDTVNIPAILTISKPAPKAAKLSATEDSALIKKWLEAQKGTTTPATQSDVKPSLALDSANAPSPQVVVPAVAPADTTKPSLVKVGSGDSTASNKK